MATDWEIRPDLLDEVRVGSAAIAVPDSALSGCQLD